MKELFIGSDLSGFTLKEAIKENLIGQGYHVEDVGTLDPEKPLPFFEVAEIGATLVQKKRFEKGILICGTGMGMSIVANKHEGVYGAACESVYAAEKCRAINDANILCMGGWIIAPILGIEMTNTFLHTSFTQNLEDWRAKRLEKALIRVKDIEKKSFDR